jgi:hypothetical protein
MFDKIFKQGQEQRTLITKKNNVAKIEKKSINANKK